MPSRASGALDDPFLSELSCLLASSSNINALEFLTDASLMVPGITASFKVYVLTTTGN